MTRLGLCVILLAFAPTLTAQDFRPDTQVGDFSFKMPQGWKRQQKATSTLLVPAGVPPGKNAFLALLPSQELKGSLRSWFDEQWANWQKDYQTIEVTPIREVRAAQGYDMVYTVARLMDKQPKEYYLIFMVGQAGPRVETWFFMTDAGELMQSFEAGLEVFQKSVRFPTAPASPPGGQAQAPGGSTNRPAGNPPQAPPSARIRQPMPKGEAGVQGIYRSLAPHSTLDLMGHFMWHYNFVFLLADGTYHLGTPERGLDNFDYRYERSKSKDYWEVYRFNGDQGTGVLEPSEGDPNGTTQKLTRQGDSVTLVDEQYFLMDPCTGLTLNGTYRKGGWESAYGDKQGITFTPDGHFQDDGINHIVGEMDLSANTPPPYPGMGTYHIANYTLALDYSDGRHERYCFYLGPNATKQDLSQVFIKGWGFVRVP